VPTFCRHNRLEANCPICSRKPRSPLAPPTPARRPAGPRSAPSTTRRRSARGGGELRVRRMARAADDGYEHELVPGLRATVEAARLADEIAFAAARLEQLESQPRGLYADVVLLDDVEEALWLAFLIAYLCPLEGDSPFAAIDRARTEWATGELPDLEFVELGPRTAHDPRRGTATLQAYRAWAQRAGSQAAGLSGDPSWTPQRRFERAFERLALPGFGRAARYDLLVTLGHLRVLDLRAWSLHLADPADPTTVAAKRVFGIGDAMNLRRRSSELGRGCGVQIEALDLALVNFGRAQDDRVTAGATVAADPARVDAIGALLGVPSGEAPAEDADPEVAATSAAAPPASAGNEPAP
jgi:hypothetical protein